MADMRAKMKLVKVSRSSTRSVDVVEGNVETVSEKVSGEMLAFTAVARSDNYPEDGSDENNTYAKWSPSASMTIMVNNPDLFGKFTPGEQFYLDFTKA